MYYPKMEIYPLNQLFKSSFFISVNNCVLRETDESETFEYFQPFSKTLLLFF